LRILADPVGRAQHQVCHADHRQHYEEDTDQARSNTSMHAGIGCRRNNPDRIGTPALIAVQFDQLVRRETEKRGIVPNKAACVHITGKILVIAIFKRNKIPLQDARFGSSLRQADALTFASRAQRSPSWLISFSWEPCAYRRV
jgi:hypothetical protein